MSEEGEREGDGEGMIIFINVVFQRFNGYDGRLDRQLEAVVMVMEALEGFGDKVQYDIVGHSGETYYIPFVDTKKPPGDDKARLETIKVGMDMVLRDGEDKEEELC